LCIDACAKQKAASGKDQLSQMVFHFITWLGHTIMSYGFYFKVMDIFHLKFNIKNFTKGNYFKLNERGFMQNRVNPQIKAEQNTIITYIDYRYFF